MDSSNIIYSAAALVGAYLLWDHYNNQAAPIDAVPDDMPDQLPTTFETIAIDAQTTLSDTVDTFTGSSTPVVPDDVVSMNRKAFLDMLAFSEGTNGPAGYQTLFGGGTFQDFSDHPGLVFTFTNSKGVTLKTTAAGRYQFLNRTWQELKTSLDLPDFGPASQDAAALELVRRRGALPDVDSGNVTAAITKCAPIWASLPGAGYDQPERKLTQLLAAYSSAGGTAFA